MNKIDITETICPQYKELFIACNCYGEVLGLKKYNGEDETFLTIYQYSFSSISFLRRIGLAIDVLCGKRIRTADLVLSEESMNKIRKFK